MAQNINADRLPSTTNLTSSNTSMKVFGGAAGEKDHFNFVDYQDAEAKPLRTSSGLLDEIRLSKHQEI